MWSLSVCLAMLGNAGVASQYTIGGIPVHGYDPSRVQGRSLTPGEPAVIMVLLTDTSASDEIAQHVCDGLNTAKSGSCSKHGHPSNGGVPFVRFKGSLDEFEDALAADPDLAASVDYLEFDAEMHGNSVPWGLDRIDQREGLDGAYDAASDGGAGVHVYVLDSGIRLGHEDFGGRAIAAFDHVRGDGVACEEVDVPDCSVDDDGHGTHVAGTVGGTVYGVAKSAALHAVKVLDGSGSGYWSWFTAGVDWVATSGQRPAIIQASIGSSGVYNFVRTACDSAVAAGVTIVVSAGNENDDACGYTAGAFDSVITVGATTETDSRATFSNYGACIDIFAPGYNILSAGHWSDTSITYMSGTSMAAPHVAGAAALVLGDYPTLLPNDVYQQLKADSSRNIVSKSRTNPNFFLHVPTDDAPAPAPKPKPKPKRTPAPTPVPLRRLQDSPQAVGSSTQDFVVV